MAMAMASSSPTLPLPVSNPPYKTQHLSSSNPPFPNLPSKTQSQHHYHHHHHQQQQQSTHVTDKPPNSEPKKPPTIRARLSQLCQEGRPDLARRLFDAIPKPNTVLWNTIIIGFVCNGMPYEALHFYARMITSSSSSSSSSTTSDSYTYSSALKACAETRELKLGKAVHCHILRTHSNFTRIVSNSLLNMYSNCLSPSFQMVGDRVFDFSQFDLVQKVFDRMRKRNVVAWNTIISWYVKTGRYVLALNQFKLMMTLGIKPTAVSFVNIFPAVAATCDRKNSSVLYGMLLKLGSNFCNDLFAVSSAIFMFSELADIVSARQVFNLSTEKNVEVWNTMIGGYVQNDLYDEGIDLFRQVLNLDHIVPDTVTILPTLTAVSQLQRLDFGQQLHAYLIKNSMMTTVAISNALIVMYSRCSSVEIGFQVFNEMREKDLVSWNTMVSAFVQNGLDNEGLMLVYEMQKRGILIDSITATALLSAASNLRNREIGEQTHAYIFRHGIQFEGMESYLIDMYAKSGLIDTAQRLFETNCIHSRDQVTWNSMISGYSQNGQVEQAFATFRQMLEQNEIANAVTLASILPACNPIGGINVGKQLHCFSLRHSMEQNVFVGTALVDMYSKCGAINYAERVFDKIPDKNSVTYTTMILGYGQHGMGKKALSMFHSMSESGMKPDAITLVAVLSACSYASLVDEGLQIFESMESEYEISPTAEHYCCVVDMLGRAGRVVEAYEFVKGLREDGNFVGIWGSLLGACRIYGEVELGKIVAERLFELEKGNSVAGYHVLLSNMYAEEGMWRSVDTLRKEMKEKGFRKEVGCSWIEIGGFTNCFTSRDEKHPQCDAIYAKLEELAIGMKAAGYRPNSGCSKNGGILEIEE